LNLPARGYSHRLQKRVAAKAVKMSFELKGCTKMALPPL